MWSFLTSHQPRWRIALEMLVLGIVVGIVGGLAVIYLGAYNVAATDKHWSLTFWLLDAARTRSIEAHAANIRVPAGLDDPAKLVLGTSHFADHCAVCHGAPGVPKDDLAEGMYPQPPDLEYVSARFSDAELFWVIKNGIKASGMPSWSQHSDEELWATVAFLKKLRGMSPEEYGKLVMQAMQAGGHRMGGDSKTDGSAAHPHDQSKYKSPENAPPHQH